MSSLFRRLIKSKKKRHPYAIARLETKPKLQKRKHDTEERDRFSLKEDSLSINRSYKISPL